MGKNIKNELDYGNIKKNVNMKRKWKRKWKSLHWKEGGLEDKINFYDYCIDESNDGKFKSDKSEKNCEIPRLSLLSETIKSLDYLDEYHIIDRERRRKIEDFLLILR